ncbi:MAG: lipopolysaccharide assembly protein LapA domain-containing protein [Gemmatimonadota bacterium]
MTTSRRWALVAGIAASLLLVPFAIFNRGQRVALDFGLWEWRGEAVYAVYGGVFLGLLAMFLLGLPADLAARGERRRLVRRVRELERDRDLDATWPLSTAGEAGSPGAAQKALGDRDREGGAPLRS